jgi:hypothetical protein
MDTLVLARGIEEILLWALTRGITEFSVKIGDSLPTASTSFVAFPRHHQPPPLHQNTSPQLPPLPPPPLLLLKPSPAAASRPPLPPTAATCANISLLYW